jgi:hypothetical protein
MSHRLQFVVNKQLRQHKQKTKRINTIHQTVNTPGVPTARRKITIHKQITQGIHGKILRNTKNIVQSHRKSSTLF